MKADDNGLNLYTLQCRNHILKPLHEHYGIDVSDGAIRQAVAEHNRVCGLIRAIGEYRKGDKPRITGYEFHVITLATYAAPSICSSTGWRRRSRSSGPASRTTRATARVCW